MLCRLSRATNSSWNVILRWCSSWSLDQLQGLGNGQCRGQGKQDIDMIGRAANRHGLHLMLSGDAAQERPEPFAQGGCNLRPALLGAEDAVVVRADVRHGAPFSRPFGTNANQKPGHPRLKPWAIVKSPSGTRQPRPCGKAAPPASAVSGLLFCLVPPGLTATANRFRGLSQSACPGGTIGNSPRFQPWDPGARGINPEGTADAHSHRY